MIVDAYYTKVMFHFHYWYYFLGPEFLNGYAIALVI